MKCVTDGAPSSRLIVEGANIFITPEARKRLFEEAGVLIIKVSSGVGGSSSRSRSSSSSSSK